jgi:transglutaminase-like putative cysteine protease
MVYRYSWIAGLASIGFAFWQLGWLLLPTGSGARWQFVVLSGFIIGLVITWTAVTYHLRASVVVLINAGALFLAAARFAAPAESVFIFPTPAGLASLWSDLTRAFDLIRNGVEPVRPVTGLVIILTALFWLLGALLAWGLSKDHPFVGLLPPLVVALQFATLDRRTGGLLIHAVFVVLVAASVFAIAYDERDRGAGRMASSRSEPPSKAPAPTAALLVALAVTVAVFGTGMLGPAVPRDGTVTWRTPGGLGGGFYGSVSYNPYVGIHDGLVSQEGIPLFRARLAGDVPPDEVYFRLLTLETYRNGQWSASRPEVYPLDQTPLEQPGHEYLGATRPLTADVEILALSQQWLPAPYAVAGADGSESEAFRIRRSDTALVFRGDRTYRNMEYRVSSAVPEVRPEEIAGAPGGGFSPLFTAAATAGEDLPPIGDVTFRELPDADRYTDLPENIDPRVKDQADDLTMRLTTPFEKGLAIEHWFRETGGFVYDLEVDQGHSEDLLASWLFDDSADNVSYRRGYCEQFATSMAVMARSVGIPTRVVLGFTPGREVAANEVVILDNNAHSWVELWIPAVGWVAFDPTPRGDGANPVTSYERLSEALGFDIAAYLEQVPEPVRPDIDLGNLVSGLQDPELDLTDLGAIDTGGPSAGASSSAPWIPIVPVAVALLLLVIAAIPIVKWARHRSRMRRLDDGDISAAWEEIVVRLTDFGAEPDSAATPTEVAETVDDAMKPLASVYSRSVYGSAGRLSSEQTDTARRSMQLTSERFVMRYSAIERFRSYYRLGSLRRRFR